MQFGLFPSNLNALQMFFCRSDEHLPHPVLRSDPSIECYNGDHWLAFVVSLLVVAICGIATPALLFRQIKRGLLAQEETHNKEMVQSTSARLTAVEKLTYQAAFERYDKNDSGTIDEEELSCILEEQAGIKPNHKEIHELKETWMGHMHGCDDISMGDFMQMMEAMKRELAECGNTQKHAMTDPLCLLYYPMRRKCYWWSIVMLLRPSGIAIIYTARNRGTGLIQVSEDSQTSAHGST